MHKSPNNHPPPDQLRKPNEAFSTPPCAPTSPATSPFAASFSIPPGKVSTYGHVAAAAGYPRLHRAVARLLRTDPPDQLPWHRVLGAGGEIKLRGALAHEQRARLKLEGVRFTGKKVDMQRFEHVMKPWELY